MDKDKNVTIDDSSIEDIKKHVNKVTTTLTIVAIILFIIAIFYIVVFDFNCLFFNGLTEPKPNWYNITESVKSFCINILPILIIFIFIKPIQSLLQLIEKLLSERKQKDFWDTKIEEIIRKTKQYPEIYKIYTSYNNVDWKELLEDATKIDFYMFYAGQTWMDNNQSIFQEFINRKGIIRVFLPADKGKNRFSSYTIQKDIEDNIVKTQQYFRSLSTEIKIQTLDSGFNYMFARIYQKNDKLFIISPYQNNIDNHNSPVFIVSEKFCNKELNQFIEKEVEYIEKGYPLPDLEDKKYIFWNKEKERVFISNSLNCPLKCKFCYVNSIIEESDNYEYDDKTLCKQIYKNIRNDKRYKEGKTGTNIMLGGFNDPLYKDNIDISLELIRLFSEKENFIHIATRCGFGEKIDSIFDIKLNVVINYSISTLHTSELEYCNQQKRFDEMKNLIDKGYKVALYLRPVIQNETLKDIDEICTLAKNAGVEVVTVGGLYVDEQIKSSLKGINIDITSAKTINSKQFVLDKKKKLKKIQNTTDMEKIINKLNQNNFRVFDTAEKRINYYKNK